MIKESLKRTFPFLTKLHQFPALRALLWLIIGICFTSKIPLYQVPLWPVIILFVAAVAIHKKTTILFLLVGVLSFSAESEQYDSKVTQLITQSDQQVALSFYSSPRYKTKEGIVQTATITTTKNFGTVDVTLKKAILPGESVTCLGSFSPFDTSSTPWSRSLYSQGKTAKIHGVFTIDTIIATSHNNSTIYAISRGLHNEMNTYSSSTNSLLKALFRADRSELSTGVKEIFKRSGIAHLLALSGQHIAVIVGCIALLCKFFPIPRQLTTLITMIVPWSILFLTGPAASIIRALSMSTFLLAVFFTRRTLSPWNTLGAAGTLYLTANPGQLFSAGFLLSFTAVAAIIGVVQIVNKATSNKVVRIGAYTILIPIAAGSCTAPIMASIFGTTISIGIIANIFLTPLFGYFFIASIPLFLLGTESTLAHQILEFLSENFIKLTELLILQLNQPPTEFVVITPEMILIPLVITILFLADHQKRKLVAAYLTLILCSCLLFPTTIQESEWKNETISLRHTQNIDIVQISDEIPNPKELIRYLKRSSKNRSLLIEIPATESKQLYLIEKHTQYDKIFVSLKNREEVTEYPARFHILSSDDSIKFGTTIHFPLQN